MVALVTPFRNGAVDHEALFQLCNRVIEGGASGVVPCGTTGESPTLSHAEHDSVVASVIEATAGRVPVIAGTGSNSTAEAIRLSRAAEEAGASAVLSVCPYYNRPSQEPPDCGSSMSPHSFSFTIRRNASRTSSTSDGEANSGYRRAAMFSALRGKVSTDWRAATALATRTMSGSVSKNDPDSSRRR